MTTIGVKALGIWMLLVVIAMLNGLFREKILVTILGIQVALPLSGLLFSLLIFAVTFLLIPFIGKAGISTYISIGILWLFLTLVFEFVFGHYVTGKSWKQIVQVLNILKGDLFVLVLVTSTIAPWLAARVRGFL